MSWKNELDRTVSDALAKVAGDAQPDWGRAVRLVNDLLAVCGTRAESHWHAGWLEETRARHAARVGSRTPALAPVLAGVESGGGAASAAEPAATATATDDDAAASGDGPAPAPASPEAVPALLDSPVGDASLWRWIGRLDAAARGNDAVRVRALCADALAEEAMARAREGRHVLRAAGRALLACGEDARAFDLTVRHLRVASDEGAKKEADGLLAEAVHRADDVLADGDEPGAMAALDRARAFATAAGLDGRAHAKVERKRGRAHQLAGRWAEAGSCYRTALDCLAPDDRYRSVLHGDLALASLEVRGTLDLLPREGRERAQEAETLLTQGGAGGEGESYNAIYTLGVLAYERGDWTAAATRFREADRLMRETRAKARIVHARSRFFLGASLLRQGVSGEALAEAEQYVTRDAHAASLDPTIKDPVFDLLTQMSPNAAIPGRGGAGAPPRSGDGERGPRRERGPRGDRGDRGPERERQGERPPLERASHRDGPGAGRFGDRGRRERAPREDRGPAPERMSRYDGPRGPREGGVAEAPRGGPSAPFAGPPAGAPGPIDASLHLAEARKAIARDPHKALVHVDGAFKARPDFEDWFAAYRLRLDALVRLAEIAEARRTYERFRAKLYERGRADRLEEVLLDAAGPMAKVLDEGALLAERADLYEGMAGRDREFVDAAKALEAHVASAGTPEALHKAAAIWREIAARGGDEERSAFAAARDRARHAGASLYEGTADELRARLSSEGTAKKVLLIVGDESRRAQAERIVDLGRRAGFEGAYVVAGARPPHRTLQDVEAAARGGTGLLLLHASVTPDLREGLRRLASDLSVALREIPYAGSAGAEPEVLAAVADAVA